MKSQQIQVVTEGAAAAAAIQDDLPLELANQEVVTFLSSTAAAAERSQVPIILSMVVEGAPDVGILSKKFLENKGEEKKPVGKKFAIHRKKRAAAVDVDVGILSNGRRRHGGQQQRFGANLNAMNEVVGRSLQSEGELPYMCPSKDDYGGLTYFDNLFDET